MKQREHFLCTKKTKTMTLFNNPSPLLQRSAILENIRWTQAVYAVLCQSCLHAACIQWIFSKMALHWSRGDEILLNKVVFVFFPYKSILVASLKSDWTTDGRLTILTVHIFILFWALTVLFTWQSMGQSQTSRFSSKIS